MLRQRVSVDDVIRSRLALECGSGRPGRVVDMDEAVNALTLTNDWNLTLADLCTHVAVMRVPGARPVEKTVAQRDELDSSCRRCARFQFHIDAGARRDSRWRARDERDGLVG